MNQDGVVGFFCVVFHSILFGLGYVESDWSSAEQVGFCHCEYMGWDTPEVFL